MPNFPTDDGRDWGYVDDEGIWRLLPKIPMLLGEYGPPPFSITMWDGRVRHIVHNPLEMNGHAAVGTRT